MVEIGGSSSDLTKSDISDLMELISAFGAEKGVVFPEYKPDGSREDTTHSSLHDSQKDQGDP
jgi:hypothetical protein